MTELYNPLDDEENPSVQKGVAPAPLYNPFGNDPVEPPAQPQAPGEALYNPLLDPGSDPIFGSRETDFDLSPEESELSLWGKVKEVASDAWDQFELGLETGSDLKSLAIAKGERGTGRGGRAMRNLRRAIQESQNPEMKAARDKRIEFLQDDIAENLADYREAAGNTQRIIEDSSVPTGYLLEGLSSFTRTAPALIAGAATRNPTVTLTPMVLATAAETETALVSQGVDRERATIAGGVSGTIEGVTELLPTKYLLDMLDKGGEHWAKKYLKAQVADAIGEFGAESTQTMVENIATTPDATWEQIVDGSLDAGVKAVLLSPLIGNASMGTAIATNAVVETGKKTAIAGKKVYEAATTDITNLDTAEETEVKAATEEKLSLKERSQKLKGMIKDAWTEAQAELDARVIKLEVLDDPRFGALLANANNVNIPDDHTFGSRVYTRDQVEQAYDQVMSGKVLNKLDQVVPISSSTVGPGVYVDQQDEVMAELEAMKTRTEEQVRVDEQDNGGFSPEHHEARKKWLKGFNQHKGRLRRAQKAVQQVIEDVYREMGLTRPVVISWGGASTRMGQRDFGPAAWAFDKATIIEMNLESLKNLDEARAIALHEMGHALIFEEYSKLPADKKMMFEELWYSRLGDSFHGANTVGEFMAGANANEQMISGYINRNAQKNWGGPLDDFQSIGMGEHTTFEEFVGRDEARSRAAYNTTRTEFIANEMLLSLFEEEAGGNSILGKAPKSFKNKMRRMFREYKKVTGREGTPYTKFLRGMKYRNQRIQVIKDLRAAQRRLASAIQDLTANPPPSNAKKRMDAMMKGIRETFSAPTSTADPYGIGLDRFNRVYEWLAGLEHVTEANKHVPGVLEYRDTVYQIHRDGQRLKYAAEQTLKMIKNKISRKRTKIFEGFFFAADKMSDEKGRRLTEEELATLSQEHGITEEEAEVARALWGDFAQVLNLMERALIQRVTRTAEPGDVTLAGQIAGIRKDFQEMRNKNYAPHTRFGEFTLEVTAQQNVFMEGDHYKAGSMVSFEMFDSEAARNKAAKEWEKKLGSKVKVGKSIVSNINRETIRAFDGVPPSMINHMAATLKLSPEQVQELKQYIQKQTSGEGFRKRMLKRKGTPGYSTDIYRVYADYMQRFSIFLPNVQHGDKLDDALSLIGKSVKRAGKAGEDTTKRAQMLKWLQEHAEYQRNPGEEWANIRSLAFIWYLGFVPKAALVNLTQIPIATLPYLWEKYGEISGSAAMVKAIGEEKLHWTRKAGGWAPGTAEMERLGMLRELEERGIINESLSGDLAAIQDGGLMARYGSDTPDGGRRMGAGARTIAQGAAFLFHTVEVYNRRITARAAYDLARKNGESHKEAIETAHRAVVDTQYEYARFNRAKLMRGRKSVLFVFQSYVTNTMWLMGRDGMTLRMMAMFLMLGGLSGLPFAENIMDILNWAMTKYAEAAGLKNPKVELRLAARDYIQQISDNPDMPDLIMHGAGRFVGPADLSGSLSLGRIIPGTEALNTSRSAKEELGRGLERAAGAPAGIALNLYNAAFGDDPDPLRRWMRAMPTAAKSVAEAAKLVQDGGYEDYFGAKKVELDMSNLDDRIKVAMRAGGFQLREVSQVRERDYLIRNMTDYYATRRKVLMSDYLWAVGKKDPELKKEAEDNIRDFNAQVPGRLRIGASDKINALKSRRKIVRKTERGQPTQKKYRGLFLEQTEAYGPVEAEHRESDSPDT